MNASVHPTVVIGRLLDRIEDPKLVKGVVSAVEKGCEVLHQVDEFDIERFELDPRLDRGKLDIWDEVACPASEILTGLRTTAAEVSTYFPAVVAGTDDLRDLELALLIDDGESAMPSPIRDPYEIHLDVLLYDVQPGEAASMALKVAELGAMMEQIAAEHQSRLRSSALRSDVPILLEELHELRCRAERLLETLIAVVMRGLSASGENNFERCLNGGVRAARLRAWSTDLLACLSSVDVAKQSDHALHTAVTALSEAVQKPEFVWLRAMDRAEVQSFRRWLRASRTPSIGEVRDRFLRLRDWAEMMGRINRRWILIDHDLNVIRQIEGLLERSYRGRALLEALEGLYGRNRGIDALVRDARSGRMPRPEELPPLLHVVRKSVQKIRARPIAKGQIS